MPGDVNKRHQYQSDDSSIRKVIKFTLPYLLLGKD